MANVVERTLQRVVAFVARLFGSPPGEPVEAGSVARLLVIRTDAGLGHLLLTTPLLRALREGMPDTRVDWLLPPQGEEVVGGLGVAHELIPCDPRAFLTNPFAFLGLVLRLRRNRYDVVVEAGAHDRFSTSQALLARLSGAKVRVGAARGEAASFYTHVVEPDPAVTLDVPARLRLLGPLGVPSRGALPETLLGTRDEDRSNVDALLKSVKVDGAFVVVNAGASDPARQLPAEVVAVVARAVAERANARLLVVWGPGEEATAREVVEACNTSDGKRSGQAAVLAPATTRGELAALLRRASVLVSNATGPAHLGVACEVPVLALFADGEAARWGHDVASFRALDAGLPKERLGREARRLAGELVGSGARAA